MTNSQPILKAQSPAALAEEYIVQSIWNGHYPVGSDLPAERELADKIGVTRTTLREVLQRLAREGWLQIQHGKPTRVNDIWETGGSNIITTILRLEQSMMPTIIANTVSLRTKMAEYYIPEAVRLNPEECLKLFDNLTALEDNAQAYAEFDYALFRKFTFVANKPVYALILNSFKQIYHQVAHLFFIDPVARQKTFEFYLALRASCEQKNGDMTEAIMLKQSEMSRDVWRDILKHLPKDFGLQ